MPEDVAEDEEAEGESLADFIRRVEVLTGTARVRVPERSLDRYGNLFLPPRTIYLVDAVGGLHESANTNGFMPVAGGDALASPVPTFPGGTLLASQYQFTNDGANSGNHVMKIEPAVGSPMIVYSWNIYNGDAAGRATTLVLSSAGAVELGILYTATLGATTFDMWPDEGGPIGPLLLPGNQELTSTVAAVAVSKATRHALTYRYFGDTAPTITNSGPTNVTIAELA